MRGTLNYWASHLFDLLRGLPTEIRRDLVVVCLAIVVYVVVAVIVRHIVPWLTENLLVGLFVATASATTVCALAVQAILCLPLRVARLAPPRSAYRMGEVTLAAGGRMNSAIRASGRYLIGLRRAPRWTLLAVVIAVLVWWLRGANTLTG